MNEREQRNQRTKEQKAQEREEKLAIQEKYGYAMLDGHREQIGNFRIEPPGLFLGRGKHPKAGKLKVSLFVSTRSFTTPW